MKKIFKGTGLVGQRSSTSPLLALLEEAGSVTASVEAARPAGYTARRFDLSRRLRAQAQPVVSGAPRLPVPWAGSSRASGGTNRPWAAIADHVRRSVQEAVPEAHGDVMVVSVEVPADGLPGPLRFRADTPRVREPLPASRLTRSSPAAERAARLQEQVDRADVLIVHDEMDALIVVARFDIVACMREHLQRLGHPDAREALEASSRTDARTEDMREWLRTRPCPNAGSSHTGITVDFGIHDGQQVCCRHEIARNCVVRLRGRRAV